MFWPGATAHCSQRPAEPQIFQVDKLPLAKAAKEASPARAKEVEARLPRAVENAERSLTSSRTDRLSVFPFDF